LINIKARPANRDKIIDRKDILNLLWGNDSFFNSRNLDVYITKLRSYLKEDPSLEIITIKRSWVPVCDGVKNERG
jgi:DNA-binding response OmpR family regulator